MAKPTDTEPMGAPLMGTAPSTPQRTPDAAPSAPAPSMAREPEEPESDDDTAQLLKKDHLTREDLDELFGTKSMVPRSRAVAPSSDAREYLPPKSLRPKNATPVAEPLIVIDTRAPEAVGPARTPRPVSTTVSTRPIKPSRKLGVIVASILVVGFAGAAAVEWLWPSQSERPTAVVAPPVFEPATAPPVQPEVVPPPAPSEPTVSPPAILASASAAVTGVAKSPTPTEAEAPSATPRRRAPAPSTVVDRPLRPRAKTNPPPQAASPAVPFADVLDEERTK